MGAAAEEELTAPFDGAQGDREAKDAKEEIGLFPAKKEKCTGSLFQKQTESRFGLVHLEFRNLKKEMHDRFTNVEDRIDKLANHVDGFMLSNNTASRNTAAGIDAVGNANGGGNKAVGNASCNTPGCF